MGTEAIILFSKSVFVNIDVIEWSRPWVFSRLALSLEARRPACEVKVFTNLKESIAGSIHVNLKQSLIHDDYVLDCASVIHQH